MQDNTIDKLETVLTNERQLLMSADFDAVLAMADSKLAAIAGLGRIDRHHPRLPALREKLDVNQRLLASAMRGVRAAIARVQEVERIRATLDVYGKSGKQVEGIRQTPKIEKTL